MEREDLFREMHEKGYQVDCYRFDIIVPRTMLGNGRKFPLLTMAYPDTKSAWFNETCRVPVELVEGVVLEGKVNSRHVRIGFLIPIINIGRFADELWNSLRDCDFDIIIVKHTDE